MTPHPHKCRTGACEGDAGFTLIEVLVTLALLSVMAALMLLVSSQFRGLVDRQADLAARREVAAIVRHLADEISAARPLPLLGMDGAQRSYMAGGEANLRFAAVVRTGSTSFGLRDVFVTMRLREPAQLIEVRRLRRMAAIPQSETEIVLAEDVEAFSLRYFTAAGWVAEWQGRTELPRAVEINLSIKRNGRIVSMSMVAPTAMP